MPSDAKLWEVRLGIYATQHDAEELVEQITRLLCPDGDQHPPPCPIPWSVSLMEEPDLDDYPELIEQARIESGQQS